MHALITIGDTQIAIDAKTVSLQTLKQAAEELGAQVEFLSESDFAQREAIRD